MHDHIDYMTYLHTGLFELLNVHGVFAALFHAYNQICMLT